MKYFKRAPIFSVISDRSQGFPRFGLLPVALYRSFLKFLSGIAAITLLLLSSGCELVYDPINNGEAPSSPGSIWDEKPIVVKKTTESPFTEADLSGTMPLSFLLDIALYNNPLTRVSWNAARASAYAYHASLSDYYPFLSYTGSLTAQTTKGPAFANSSTGVITNPNGTATTSTQTFSTFLTNNLNLTYLLLDFGGRNAKSELALQILTASNWQHNATMQQVMLSLLNAYVSYIGNKGLVAGFEQDLKDYEVALKAAKAMKAAGLATSTDVLLVQSNLEQTRTNLFQAQGEMMISRGQILTAAGLSPDAAITVEDLPQKLPVIDISGDISGLIELAKQKRPDLGIAIAAIKQQEAQLAISYSNSMPILTANANWNQTRFISPRKAPGYNETAFLQMDFPIFQGFFFMNQQRELRAQIEAALASLDVQVAAVSLQVVTNYYLFTSAEAAIPSSEAAVEFSERAFRGFIVQYRTGTASILDVLTALTVLSNARSQRIVIRTQWAGSLANLAFSVGVLYDTSGHWQDVPPEQLSEIPTKDDNVRDNNALNSQ